MKKVCIIGLGYVGLPLICLCAKKGHFVYGLDIDKKKINLINKGINPIKDKKIERCLKNLKKKFSATTKESVIKKSEIVIICVPTPVGPKHQPDFSFLKSASKMISKNLKKNQLVVVESTVSPGCTEEIAKPILEKSGLKAGSDFYLAYCPERIDPGNKKWCVENIPRILGAINKKSLEKSYDFYRSILKAPIMKMSSIKSAEAVKIMENSFRDVNIAFVNELAKSFDKMGIDIVEVIEGASTKPFGFMKFWPSCGVGGHCIPVDPYYLIKRIDSKFDHKFLKLAREINDSMPRYTVKKVKMCLKKIKKGLIGTQVAILGLAYKGGVGDLRGSPALQIIGELKKSGARLKIFDPYVPKKSNVKNLKEALKKSICVVIATDHPEFKKIDLNLLKRSGVKIIIDGKNILDKKRLKKIGIIYKGIGR